MTKKFIIKEAYMLDKDGHKKIKLTELEKDEIPSLVEVEKINGGYGNINKNK